MDLNLNSKLKNSQEHKRTVGWPRSSEPLLDPSSDSFLFTVHLRRAAHPYPLKPFSRAVAGLNLQLPGVKALVSALNDSVNQSHDQRVLIRALPIRQVPRPIRSTSPPTSYYPETEMMKTMVQEATPSVSLMSSYVQRLIDQNSSNTSPVAPSPMLFKIQGKRHESDDWTRNYSPSKSALEALRYSTDKEGMSLGKSRAIPLQNKAPPIKVQPPFPPPPLTLSGRDVVDETRTSFIPTSLSPPPPPLLLLLPPPPPPLPLRQSPLVLPTNSNKVSHNGEEETKHDVKQVDYSMNDVKQVDSSMNDVKQVDSSSFSSAPSALTLQLISVPNSPLIHPSHQQSHERRHVHESRNTSIPCYKNFKGGDEIPPDQPMVDLRSELHLRFEPGSPIDKRVFSSPLRQLSSVRRLNSNQVAMSLSPTAFEPNIDEEKAATEAFALQHEVLKRIPVAGVGSKCRDARNVAHQSTLDKKRGGSFLREVGGIDGAIAHRRHPPSPPPLPSPQIENATDGSHVSLKRMQWARLRNESGGVTDAFQMN